MATSTATATFTSSQDSVAVTWATAFTSPPTIVTAGIVVTDGQGPVSVTIPGASLTSTGCSVEPSGRFAGSVQLIANGV